MPAYPSDLLLSSDFVIGAGLKFYGQIIFGEDCIASTPSQPFPIVGEGLKVPPRGLCFANILFIPHYRIYLPLLVGHDKVCIACIIKRFHLATTYFNTRLWF